MFAKNRKNLARYTECSQNRDNNGKDVYVKCITKKEIGEKNQKSVKEDTSVGHSSLW